MTTGSPANKLIAFTTSVNVPVKEQIMIITPTAKGNKDPMKGEILLISQRPIFISYYEMVLKSWGYSTKTVDDLPAGTISAVNEKPFVVMVDIVTGRDLTLVKRVRTKFDPSIPIIYLVRSQEIIERASKESGLSNVHFL